MNSLLLCVGYFLSWFLLKMTADSLVLMFLYYPLYVDVIDFLDISQ